MSRKQISKTKYLAVFATTTLIFIIGLIIGQSVSNAKLADLEKIENDLRIKTMAMEQEYQLLSENPCINPDSTYLSEELYELGSKLNHLEQTRGRDDPLLLRLKEYYSLLEIRHWTLLKRIKDKCNKKDINIILYFYSNKGDCDECEEQGYILTYIRENNPDTKIYTFDVNLNNAAVNALKQIYLGNNTSLPAIVINEKTEFGFKDKKEIEQKIRIKRY